MTGETNGIGVMAPPRPPNLNRGGVLLLRGREGGEMRGKGEGREKGKREGMGWGKA